MAKFCLFHSAQTILVMVFLICSLNSFISSTMMKFKDSVLLPNSSEVNQDIKLIKTSNKQNMSGHGVNLIRAGQRASVLIPVCCTLLAARFLIRDSNI